MSDPVDAIKNRISALEAQRADVKAQLEAQIETHLRSYDVALNELKGILLAIGGPELTAVDLKPVASVLRPVLPHASRASDPNSMMAGDGITPDQMRALNAAQNKSSALEEAVRAANPTNILRRKLKGLG